ncbi:MAG: sporulation protein [Ruminococcus sp.]|nr:sporulation protein [Ruminococcus sp.]MBO5382856.1 sporulation protein [Ruminococcus sp.]MBR6670588.1 sporulation protein [Ruminococcus sp.]
MNMRIPLKSVSVIMAAALSYAGFNGITTAETTLEVADLSTANISVNENTDDDCEVTEWWKAEITDYDSSLSLISYEMTPEATQTENEESQAQENVLIDGDENNAASSDESVNTEPSFVASPDTVSPGPVQSMPEQEKEAINAQSGQFVFTTYGWGHGVGMSQNGANFYAMYSGWSYQDILFHYYPGTYLMNTGTADSEQVTVAGVSGDVLSMVAGIVYREVGGSMSTEAIKAQAVAVYSYIKYYGNDSHDLRTKANPPQNVIDACASVLGEALYYNGDYALTMFSASSGGTTANCYDVFSMDIPYLRSVTSDYDASCDPHYGTVKYISSSEVKRLVEARYGIKLSDDPLNWFKVMEGDSGYINNVLIDGQITVRGNDLKICLGLKSPMYDIAYAQ